MVELPTGTVTFLFTDIEGSVVRWEQHPTQMKAALSQHDAILRDTIARHDGVLCQTAGDSFVVGFTSAPPALEMALSAQRALTDAEWPPETGALRVRMAIQTGHAEMRPEGYDANHTLSRQARLLATAHGGQIVVSHESRDLLADHLPPGVELRDLGELWLKDLIDPVGVFQVVASAPPWSLPSEFPPLRGRDTRPGNLPSQTQPFIGREQTVDEVCRMVTEGSLRLTTLLGPGGIGKTRLALYTAERLQHRFADGVFFVDLASITDAGLVVPTIATVVGVSEGDGRSVAEAVAQHMAELDLLLVLDNLEQVVDAAPGIASLLAAAPGLRILATSRIPLQIQGEAHYPVAPLGLPDLDRLTDLETLAEVEAVELFVQRAQAAKPGFALTQANAAAVAAICHRLDGVPLALVLAAARSKILSPKAMLDRLDDRLTLLAGEARDLPARQQTLRNTLEWSHDLLDDEEKELYARWSVFAGGFRLDAAEAIAAGGDRASLDALEGIASLVDNSLLTTVDTFDGDTRYRMLETINEYAREKLAEIEGPARSEHLHARYFLDLAEAAAEHLEGEHLVEWSLRLEEEHDNLRAALARGFERAEQGDVEVAAQVVRLSSALGLFWLDRGYLTEGNDQLQRTLELVPLWHDAAVDDEQRRRADRASATIQDMLGGIARRLGDLDRARAFLEASLEVYRRLGDDQGRGRVLGSLGTVSYHQGDLADARTRYTHGLELSRESGDQFNVVNGLVSLGNLERDTGNHEVARSLYEQCLAVAEEVHEYIGQSVALNNLANLALDTGDPERAAGLHVRSLEIRYRVGHRMMLAESMVGVACVDIALDRPLRAARLVGCAEGIADAVGGTFDPKERRLHQDAVAALGVALGEDQLAAERSAGRTMGLDAAVAFALTVPPPAG